MNSRWLRPALFTALLLALAASVTTAAAAPADSGRSARAAAHAKRLLPKAQQGQKALRTLTPAQEAAAAKLNRRSLDGFRKLLAHDPTVWVSPKGMLFYADRADASEVGYAAEQDTTRAAQAWASFPESQTFQLHSKPGSKHTIYLDFNGYTLKAGAAWTEEDPDFPGEIIPAGTYGGFSRDGSAAFSSVELADVQTVWRIVSEKFAPFDIDVTTADPGTAALNRADDADPTYGTRVVLTNDMRARGGICTATASGGCSGVSWVGVFDLPWESYDPDEGFDYTDYFEPAWVYTRFTNTTGVFSAGTLANIAAHEAGHTLGLDHDLNAAGDDYYEGHGDWFPIMGSGDRAVGHFTDASSYPGAVTGDWQEDPITWEPDPDDLSVISKYGAPRRADDVSSPMALGSLPSYSVSGIIERRTDADTFTINRTCSGDLTASATGIGLGQAVDLKLTVTSPSSSVTTVSPDTTGNTSTDPDTPIDMDAGTTISGAGPGTWTFAVEGVGLAGATGYTDYGSLGMYQLDISGCEPAAGAFVGVSPTRLLDTRIGLGAPKVQVGAGQTVTFPVAGSAGVPTAASAAVLNVTVTKGTKGGYVTAYPAASPRPGTSNVAFAAAQTIATHTTVKLGSGGAVTLFNGSSAPVDLIADVAGWYQGGTATNSGMFTPLVGARLAAAVPAGANGTVAVAVGGRAEIPADAGAGAFNVTVSGPTAPGYITAFPNGTTRPNASNVNFLAGQTVANAATTKLGVGGKVALFNGSTGTTKVTTDVSGWFTAGAASAPGGYTSLNPARILDTRNGTGAAKAQVPAGGSITLTVAGSAGVPATGAGAAVLNVTVTRPGAAGYVTAYPSGTPRPVASNVNFVAGQTIPNLVTVKLGGGKVTFFNGSTKPVDVVADVAGWYLG